MVNELIEELIRRQLRQTDHFATVRPQSQPRQQTDSFSRSGSVRRTAVAAKA